MTREGSLYRIQNLPESERPRERLLKHGPEALSTAELIAVILGSGTRGVSVLDLAQGLISHFGTLQKLSEATVEELCQMKGMGRAKAIQLRAAISLGLRTGRIVAEEKYRIRSPQHAYQFVKEELEKEKREVFLALLLDVKGCVIGRHVVSIGTLSNSLVHPREAFYPAIRHKASSVVLAHNHPSGDPTPSPDDISTTQRLVEAGKMIGIPVQDHLIVGANSFVSLRQKDASLFS